MKKRESRTMEDPTRNVDGGQLRRELRRAAVWTALALAAVVAVYYLALAPLTDPLDPRASRWEENAYTNRALGLRFTLPEGWEFLEQEQLEGLSEQLPAESRQLMMAVDPETGVNVQIQCMGGFEREKTDGAAIRSQFSTGLDMMAGQSDREWLEPMKIGGASYEVLHVQTVYAGTEAEQYILIGSARGHMAMVFLSGKASEEPEQYLAAFSGA